MPTFENQFITFNKQVFISAKPDYQKALQDSGYKNMNLKYRKTTNK